MSINSMVIDIKRIDELLARRCYEDALEACISNLEQDENNIEFLERKAEACKGIGDLTLAIKCLDRIIDLYPHGPSTYFKKSIWLVDSGIYEPSIELLKKVIEMDSDYFGEISYFALAEIFCRQKKCLEAQEAISYVSSDYEVRYMFGYKKRTAGDLKSDIEKTCRNN